MFSSGEVCGINSFKLFVSLVNFLTSILCRYVEITETLPLDYEFRVSEMGLFFFRLYPQHLA